LSIILDPEETRMQLRRFTFLTALTAMLVGGSVCSSYATTYEVREANADPLYAIHPGGTAVWLPGVGSDFVFTTPGTFTTAGTGASLTGTVWSQSDSQNGFALNIQFSGLIQSGDSGFPPADSPKLELKPSAYAENGGPVNVNEWLYYTAFTGTLTGVGNYTGFEIDLVRMGPSFQMGYGANGKNLNFGGSGWFSVTASRAPQGKTPFQLTGHGDFNLDFARIISDPPPPHATPEPTSVVLLASGLIGVAVARRRKQA
jgi:hypothetical protein